jgi:Flp pilus assembly CpaF family ATPase
VVFITERRIASMDGIAVLGCQPDALPPFGDRSDLDRLLTSTELVARSLRLRPGQSILGEVYDEETATMLEAWSISLQGSATTIQPDMPKQL